MQLKYAVLLGSVRRDRMGMRAARLIMTALAARGHAPTLVDPLVLQLPLLDRMYKEYPKGEAPENLAMLAELYRSVDGFLIVSAEYNHGIPPALKNLLDHFLEEYFFRPSAIACYEWFRRGAGRHAAADDARRTRHVEHPEPVPDPEDRRGPDRGRNAGRAASRAIPHALPRRVRLVCPGPETGTEQFRHPDLTAIRSAGRRRRFCHTTGSCLAQKSCCATARFLQASSAQIGQRC